MAKAQAEAEVSVESTIVDHDNLVEALAAVIAEMPAIGKDNTMGGNASYQYRSIEQIVPHVARLFSKHQIIVVPRVLDRIDDVHKTSSSEWKHVKLLVEFTVFHASNKTTMVPIPGGSGFASRGFDTNAIVGSAWGEGVDSMDKATNKAHTGAYKNFLIELLHINDGSDPDHDPSIESPRDNAAVELLDPDTQAALIERIGGLDDDDRLKVWANIGRKSVAAIPAAWHSSLMKLVDKYDGDTLESIRDEVEGSRT